MLKIERQYKAGVISGLAASFVFVYFLQPILDWVSHTVASILTLVGSAYVDRIYTQAAHLETQDFSFLLFVFVSGLLVSTALIVGFRRVFNLEKKPSNAPEFYKQNNNTAYRIISGAIFVALGLFFAAVVSANYMQLRAISSFNQHMKALGPYLTSKEERQLLSEWALMNSAADYSAIYDKLYRVAINNGIILPPNKLYTPTAL